MSNKVYTLPDGSTRRGDEAFSIARSYDRVRTLRTLAEEEIAPAHNVAAMPEVLDDDGAVLMEAVPAHVVAAVTRQVEIVETVTETVTEPVQYPPGWLAAASAEELAEVGIVASLDVAAMRAERVAAAWAECVRRLDGGVVTVTTSAGTHQYGLDAEARNNVSLALVGVLSGLSPNPRSWTPKGVAAPIAITHDDMRLIAGAVGLAYETHMQAYLAHKLAVQAAAADAVADYDVQAGWPT